MRESRSYGSVRGAISDGRPYRNTYGRICDIEAGRGSATMTLATSWRNCTFRPVEVCAGVALLLTSAQAVWSQQPRESPNTKFSIERIELTGNLRIQTSTIMAHIFARPGDRYSAEGIKRDAQALRDTGYFDEVQLRIADSPDRPDGKIVEFGVREKPLVALIEYKGIKSITEAEIVQFLKENKVDLSVGSQFDNTVLKHAATIIEELLSKRGRPAATVKPTYERNGNSNVVTILFTVDEAPKAKASTNSHPRMQ
jgi:outer membrane protein assembly factor BamA